MRPLKFPAAALIISAAAVLFSSSGCATRQARDEHAAQKHALETLEPVRSRTGLSLSPSKPATDSDLVKALENLEPAP